jgi:magnesium chelatase family protein
MTGRHDKILRVARTTTDLDSSAAIQPEHVSEAVNYRILDRQFWS